MEKYLKGVGWCSAIMGFFAYAVALQLIMNAGFLSMERLDPNVHVPFTFMEFYTYFLAFILFVFGSFMLTNSHKLKKYVRVSKIPYSLPLIVFCIDLILFIQFHEFTGFEMAFRSVIPALAVLSLIQLVKISHMVKEEKKFML